MSNLKKYISWGPILPEWSSSVNGRETRSWKSNLPQPETKNRPWKLIGSPCCIPFMSYQCHPRKDKYNRKLFKYYVEYEEGDSSCEDDIEREIRTDTADVKAGGVPLISLEPCHETSWDNTIAQQTSWNSGHVDIIIVFLGNHSWWGSCNNFPYTEFPNIFFEKPLGDRPHSTVHAVQDGPLRFKKLGSTRRVLELPGDGDGSDSDSDENATQANKPEEEI